MKMKFVQIACGTIGDGTDGGYRDHTLYALGADGSVWTRRGGDDSGWYEMGGQGRELLDLGVAEQRRARRARAAAWSAECKAESEAAAVAVAKRKTEAEAK